MSTEYFVEIIETSTGKLVRKISAGYSMRSAELANDGILMNMDDERYHTEIVTYDESARKGSGAGNA